MNPCRSACLGRFLQKLGPEQAEIYKLEEYSMYKIGFAGAGNLAETLIQGLLNSGAVQASEIQVTDVSEDRKELMKKKFGVTVQQSNRDLVQSQDIIFLTLKPQVIVSVLKEISEVATGRKIFITPAAGVSLAFVESFLPESPVIRIMPNTSCLVLEGTIAICPGARAKDGDIKLVSEVLGKLGRVIPVAENMMDAVTALSGSGPAWIYTVIEALADGGVKVGLPKGLALTLAAQTVMGAAKMVLETHEHPAVLRDKVTSPGGTTIAGSHALERGAARSALMDAVVAAYNRAKELAPDLDGKGH